MLKMKWVVDECQDANGYWTIRISDGTANGDMDKEPIATVYSEKVAKSIVDEHNKNLSE